MTKHIALLRGINVGGRHMLPMRQLVGWFEGAGCSDVVTYIQSGNVVFEASAALVRRLPETISEHAREELGFDAPIVTRSARDWNVVLRSNPYLERADEKQLAVGFLQRRPQATRVASLDPARSPPDQFAVAGREIFLCVPGGMARSKLTNAYFDSRLDMIVTFRNWRTVCKLAQLL